MIKSKNNDNNVPWGFWSALFISVFAFFFSILLAALASIALEDSSINEIEKNLAVYAINTATLLIIALLFIKNRGLSWKKFFKPPDEKASFLALPVYYLIYLFLTICASFLFDIFPWFNADQDQQLGFSGAIGGLSLLFVFIALAILPPLGEEVIFRGILYPGFKKNLNKVLAAFISSLLFGLAHMQWNVGVDTFVLSLVIIYAMEKHKSLWMAIGLHGIKNLIAFLALFVFNK